MADDFLEKLLKGIRTREPRYQYTLVEWQDVRDFIDSINLPHQMYVGQEIVTTDNPVVVLRRRKSVIKEIFSRPIFCVTKKVRLTFHWEGIHVIGANMVTPNCFILPVPNKKNLGNWYFKVSCLPTCAPGIKPLYITVDTLRENLILKEISVLSKVFAVLSLLALITLPFLYFINDTVRMYINLNITGKPGTGYITIASLILFSIIILSKRFDEIFTTLQQDKSYLVTDEHGAKMIGSSGIEVKKSPNRRLQQTTTTDE